MDRQDCSFGRTGREARGGQEATDLLVEQVDRLLV
jgi:hypothetical protein